MIQYGFTQRRLLPAQHMTEKLYVGHLPPRFEREDIMKLFSIFGKVTNVEIIMDPASSKFKGDVFVEYSNDFELQKAASGAMGLKLETGVLETRKVSMLTSAETIGMQNLMQNALTSIIGNTASKTNALTAVNADLQNLLEAHISRVIKLKNMVDPTQLKEKTYIDDLLEDIQEECAQHGRIVSIEIPKPSHDKTNVSGLGYVFIEYDNVDQSQRAKKELHGTKFNGRRVEAVYYPEDQFRKKMLDL